MLKNYFNDDKLFESVYQMNEDCGGGSCGSGKPSSSCGGSGCGFRESVMKESKDYPKGTYHCFRVFDMHPDIVEKLESISYENPDWLVQFTPKDKNYFLLTTDEIKSKDQLRDLIGYDGSYQVQLLF